MSRRVALSISLLVACAARGGEPIRVGEPVAPSQPSDGGHPSELPAEDSRRATLEASCFAEPFKARDAGLDAMPLGPEREARLHHFLSSDGWNCRDDGEPKDEGRLGGPYPARVEECRYAIARVYYQVRWWAPAARWFRRVVAEHRDTEVAVFAAELYLRSLHSLGSDADPRRPECHELLVEDADRLTCLLCRGPEPSSLCRSMGDLRRDALSALGRSEPEARASCAH